MRVLFSDNLHFHKRNFKSLIEFSESNFAEIFYNSEHNDLCSLKGNYTDCAKITSIDTTVFNEFSIDELLKYSYKSVNVYSVCRAELLCYISTSDKFIEFNNNFSAVDELGWIKRHFYKDLILNYAASIFWIDFWYKKFSELPVIHKVIVFSGSTIYTKSLLEICKKKQSDAYVAETFFTGNEFYLERKNTHIANNSDLKFDTYLNSMSYDDDDFYNKEKIKAHNKIRMSKNKNVTQPEISSSKFFDGKGFALIIGQVVNDFSVLENKAGIRNTIEFYKCLILKILDNSSGNIVFKAHPWERHNVNLRKPKTFSTLMTWREALPIEYQKRLVITEDYNLLQLLSQTEAFFTICSQAALEACYHGFKPVQLGNAFYGNKGFTHDYGYNDIDRLVKDYSSQRLSGKLSLKEYSLYEKFMTIALQKHLISVHKSGHILLREIFSDAGVIKLSQVTTVSMSVTKPATLVANKEEAKQSNKASSLSLTQRRLRKLRKTPRLYFKDSKYKSLRFLALLFKD